MNMLKESTAAAMGRETPRQALLWQAVIANTITDWLSGSLRQKREAEQYLFNDNMDFLMVCQSAGMDAETLRAGLETLRSKNASNGGAFAA
jgi:hypothetical protein